MPEPGAVDPESRARAAARSFWESRATEGAWRGLYAGPEDLRRHPFLARLRALEQLLGKGRFERALDAGCATADYAGALRSRGASYVGIDSSPTMIADAATSSAGSTFVAAVEDLPFADTSFDVAIALGLLGFLPDPRAALVELARVLRPGGILIVQCGRRDLLARAAGRARSGQGPERLLEASELDALAQALGFRREARRSIDFVFLPGRLRLRFPRLAVGGSRVLERLSWLAAPLARSYVTRYRRS